MKSVKSCSQVMTPIAKSFIPGELYRFGDERGGLALVIGVTASQGFVVDRGTSIWEIGTVYYVSCYEPVHLPNAVIVTNEK